MTKTSCETDFRISEMAVVIKKMKFNDLCLLKQLIVEELGERRMAEKKLYDKVMGSKDS